MAGALDERDFQREKADIHLKITEYLKNYQAEPPISTKNNPPKKAEYIPFSILSDKIRTHQDNFESTSLKDDRAILLKIGKELRGKRRPELEAEPELVLKVEDFLDDIDEKWFLSGKSKSSPEEMLLFNRLHSKARELGGKTARSQMGDESYFFQIKMLGQALMEFAPKLKAVAIPIIVSASTLVNLQ